MEERIFFVYIDRTNDGRVFYVGKVQTARIGRAATEETRQKLSKVHSGEGNAAAKLNETQVKEIRELYKTGNYTHRELGSIFGVTKTTAGDIIRNKIWKNI